MLELSVKMARCVSIRSYFQARLSFIVFFVPGGAIQTVAVTPRGHQLVEAGSDGVGDGEPRDLVVNRDMKVLAVDWLTVPYFLGTRKRPQGPQSIAPGAET